MELQTLCARSAPSATTHLQIKCWQMKDLCFLSLRLRLKSEELFVVEIPFQIYKLVFLQVELASQEDGRTAYDGRRHVEVSYSEAGVF